MPPMSLATLISGTTEARHEQMEVLVKRVRARGLCTQVEVKGNVARLKFDPELWFPAAETGKKAAQAARIACQGCMVQSSCLEWTLREEAQFGDVHGVRGGLAPDERHTLIRARIVGAQP